jgi:sulfur carrier protein ThiS adenylyltransferase
MKKMRCFMDERFSRQADIVPHKRIMDCKATIVGVGAIGRQVASQLAAIGIPWMQLIDFDVVEESNIASQGYFECDLKRFKVHATADICQQVNPKLELYAINERFKRTAKIGNILFCCVDKIETRRLIWESVKDKVNFFGDGRMSAEVLRIITACDEKSRKYYPQTLFTAQQAQAGPCTAKTTIYCANIAAGFMLAQFTKYLRLLPVDSDIQINLLASELNVGSC